MSPLALFVRFYCVCYCRPISMYLFILPQNKMKMVKHDKPLHIVFDMLAHKCFTHVTMHIKIDSEQKLLFLFCITCLKHVHIALFIKWCCIHFQGMLRTRPVFTFKLRKNLEIQQKIYNECVISMFTKRLTLQWISNLFEVCYYFHKEG